MGCAAMAAILSRISRIEIETRRTVRCDLIVRESTTPPSHEAASR
jgi:hypothetical protein